MSHANERGFRLEVHAIGDRAAEQVLDALDSAHAFVNPLTQEHTRPVLTHCQVLGDDLIDRMASRGVIANVQPPFTLTDMQWVQRRILPEVQVIMMMNPRVIIGLIFIYIFIFISALLIAGKHSFNEEFTWLEVQTHLWNIAHPCRFDHSALFFIRAYSNIHSYMSFIYLFIYFLFKRGCMRPSFEDHEMSMIVRGFFLRSV